MADIFAAPRHAYTRGLIGSVPRAGGERRPLLSIEGTPPGLGDRPTGCAFHPRCGFATDLCRRDTPPLSAIALPAPVQLAAAAAPGRVVACWHQDAVGGRRPGRPDRDGARVTAGPLLSLEDVVVRFAVPRTVLDRIARRPARAVHALNGVRLDLHRGETLGLVGESGCGKSTLARAAVRLLDPDAGRVRFEGRDIAELRGSARRAFNRRAQMVFQDPYGSLNPRMTVRQVLAEALSVHRTRPKAQIPARIADLIDLVRLPSGSADRLPHAFSGGQRQRIGIARALAVEPDLLVADELVSALDMSVQAQVVDLLLDLQARLGLTVLFVAHDLRLVRHISHRVAVMYLGSVMEVGPSEALFRAPRHPYTRALLDAAPDLDPTRRTGAAAARGELPSPFAVPPGCPFNTRCPLAFDRCRAERPALTPRGPAHRAACHVVDFGEPT